MIKKILKIIQQLLDAALPNYVFIHPRVEVISETEWEKVATLDSSTVLFNVHIEHTGNGEGVLLSFIDKAGDRFSLGPYFGDILAPAPNTVPNTDITRRARPQHIFAKLDVRYHLPDEAATPREQGPLVSVEQWSMIKHQGSIDEVDDPSPDRSTNSFMDSVSLDQQKIAKAMADEEAQDGSP